MAVESTYFDTLVNGEGDFNPFTDRGWQTIAARFTEWVRPQKPLDVLDIGCGTGQSRQLYIQHAKRYIGLDLSYEALVRAHRQFPDSQWLRGNACELPFAENSFDVVVFSSVLHHIPDFPDAVREAFRVVRPGGYVFAFDPNVLHPAMALFRHPGSPLYSPQGVSPNERPLLPRTLYRAFAQNGFVHVRQRGQSDIPYRAVAPRLMNTFLKCYNVLDWGWERSGLGRWMGTFVITCAQKPA